MGAVRVSDEVKGIVDRHVAAGSASTDEAFVEQAVRLYAEYLEDNEAELISAAEEGLEAVRRGEYTTIGDPADAAAFWDGVWIDALQISAQQRRDRSSNENGSKSDS